jgi:hypothetical protein
LEAAEHVEVGWLAWYLGETNIVFSLYIARKNLRYLLLPIGIAAVALYRLCSQAAKQPSSQAWGIGVNVN